MKAHVILLGAIVSVSLVSGQAEASQKALINDDFNSPFWHQGLNYFHFLDRAPEGWTASVAGAGGGGIPGEGWDPYSGGQMISRAADEGFDIVMHYGPGFVDPEAVVYALDSDCAVFTFHFQLNEHQYFDYRDFGSVVKGAGPTPAMIVSGGHSTS